MLENKMNEVIHKKLKMNIKKIIKKENQVMHIIKKIKKAEEKQKEN